MFAVCVQLYCRYFTVLHLVSLFTLHVSGYMAIFKCVGCFIFVFLRESASLVLLVVTICTFPSVEWVKYEVLFIIINIIIIIITIFYLCFPR
jgi:hypothetical protein